MGIDSHEKPEVPIINLKNGYLIVLHMFEDLSLDILEKVNRIEGYFLSS